MAGTLRKLGENLLTTVPVAVRALDGGLLNSQNEKSDHHRMPKGNRGRAEDCPTGALARRVRHSRAEGERQEYPLLSTL